MIAPEPYYEPPKELEPKTFAHDTPVSGPATDPPTDPGALFVVPDPPPAAPKPPGPAHDERLFARFWAAYPRKVGKLGAARAWGRAVRLADPEVIIAAALAYAEDPARDRKFTKHPQTWLNAGCWDDEADDEPAGGEAREVEYEGW